ncbi:MAG: fluoride efflux transporter CrcB [Gammaproteobacteria bacterium]|nr:fluoride efflux transporter CrcB [Gammaproteobacteria bacterium]
MIQLLAIAVGGAVGAVMRYLASTAVYNVAGRDFPWGTLVVNVAGSLLMGILFVVLTEKAALPPVWRATLLVGVLGAFTTFSTFSIETVALMEQGDWLKAAGNILLSVVLCTGGAWLGLVAGRQL